MFSLNSEKATPIATIQIRKKKSILCISEAESHEKDLIEFDKCEIFPNIDTRDIIYICGASGCGKSTWAATYIKNFRKLFPDSRIYVLSRLTKDPALDDSKLGIIRIPINDELLTDPIDIMKELKNCCVLFDDCNTIQNPKLKLMVSKTMNDILECGRHNNIYTLITSHLINMNEKKDSRTILNEWHSIVIFPRAGNKYQIRYALKTYFGLSPNKINSILKIHSRWVLINKQYPSYVLSEQMAWTI